MQQFIRISILIAVLFSSFPLLGQQITRSVIGSIGGSYQSGNGLRLSATVAQPPNAGTISNGQYYIRQGFQQPSSCANAPAATFEYQTIESESCKSIFIFSYTGVANEQTTFQWSFGEGASIPNSTAMNPEEVVYENPGLKNISLTVSTGTCSSTQQLDLEVIQMLLSYDASVQDIICYEDMDGSIDLLVENGTAPFTIQWEDGTSDFQLNNLLPGAYSFTLTDAQNCQLTDTIAIEGPEQLVLSALADKSTCIDMTDGSIVLDLSGGTQPYTYEWSNNATDPNLIGIPAGMYSVTVTDENKCFQVLDVEVSTACQDLQFYDILTPNGDGQNDNWVIDGIESYPNNELLIYDRWGRLVFTTTAYTGNWDGRSNDGKALPMGAYYFILRLNDSLNTMHNGSITLIR